MNFLIIAGISARYVLAILGSVGMGIIYGLKVNLHVAIVSMVNHTATRGTGDLGHHSGGSACGGEAVESDDMPAEVSIGFLMFSFII